LAQLLRADLLPEAWIAPLEVRQLRALLRHRASLVRLGTQLRNRIHAVAADHGYDRTASYWTGPGRGWLAELDLPPVSREIVTGFLAFIDALAPQIDRLDGEVRARASADPRVKILTTLPGVGEFTALLMLAEIGDITRFGSVVMDARRHAEVAESECLKAASANACGCMQIAPVLGAGLSGRSRPLASVSTTHAGAVRRRRPAVFKPCL
jgi:hypothetical protein